MDMVRYMSGKSLLAAAIALLLTVAHAHAQQAFIAPVPFAGQGIMTVTSASQAVSVANVTTAPNSSVFPPSNAPLPTGLMRVKLQFTATANLTVCWRGGTCTATNGEVLAPGESRVVAVPTFSINPVTMFASSSVSVEVEW